MDTSKKVLIKVSANIIKFAYTSCCSISPRLIATKFVNKYVVSGHEESLARGKPIVGDYLPIMANPG